MPFFGIPAATITTTSTLWKMVRSPVVPFYPTRQPGARGYRLTLLPALEKLPGPDIETATRRVNDPLEKLIREQGKSTCTHTDVSKSDRRGWRMSTNRNETPALYDSER